MVRALGRYSRVVHTWQVLSTVMAAVLAVVAVERIDPRRLLSGGRTASELSVGRLQHLSPQVGEVGDRAAVAGEGNGDLLLPDGPVCVIDPARSGRGRADVRRVRHCTRVAVRRGGLPVAVV